MESSFRELFAELGLVGWALEAGHMLTYCNGWLSFPASLLYVRNFLGGKGSKPWKPGPCPLSLWPIIGPGSWWDQQVQLPQ